MARDDSAPATKGDLQYFMTIVMDAFHDFESRYATKEDLRASQHSLRTELMRHVDVRFEQLRHDFAIYPEVIKDHGKRIRRLETKAGIA